MPSTSQVWPLVLTHPYPGTLVRGGVGDDMTVTQVFVFRLVVGSAGTKGGSLFSAGNGFSLSLYLMWVVGREEYLWACEEAYRLLDY